MDFVTKVTCGDLAHSRFHLPNRADHRPGDCVAQYQRQDHTCRRHGNNRAARINVCGLTRFNARHHVRLGLVHQFVGETFQAVRKRRGFRKLYLPALCGFSLADQVHDTADDLDEFLIIRTHLRHHFHLILGDELQAVEVVAELLELTQRCVKAAILCLQHRRGNAIKLTDGIVIELAVGGDLALQLHHVFGALIDFGEGA